MDKGSQATLIPNTQSVIHKLAQLSQDMNSLETHFDGPINQSSRMAVQLMLSYHHVSILNIPFLQTDLTFDAVCGSYNKAFGNVCSSNARCKGRRANATEYFAIGACLIAPSMLCELGSNYSSDSSKSGR